MRLSAIRVGILSVGLLACSAAVNAQQGETDWQDPYLTGDVARYPAPQAVATVSRVADLTPDPFLAAVPADTKPVALSENKSVRVELLRAIHGDAVADLPAPEGMEALVLVTRWTDIHPRALIEKSRLEGKTDRTYGAGGLFSGGDRAAGDKELVKVDVPYKVPNAGQHAFVATGGMAWDLRPESGALPNGLLPDSAFAIDSFGNSREIRFAYFVPKGASDVAFRFFDYSNGHITLPVAGDPEKAMAGADPVEALDRGKVGDLEIAVAGVSYTESYAGVTAPDGWRFAIVDVFGRSDAGKGGVGAIAKIDPSKYAWLVGDGGYIWYGLPLRQGGKVVAFTPELFQRREMVFLVPADIEHFKLGLRGDGEVGVFNATPQAPTPLPNALVSHADGAVLELGLFGLRWEGDRLVADLSVTPKSGTAGIELRLDRQFALVDADGAEVSPDMESTMRLAHRPPSPSVAPPGTPMRFELAFRPPATFVLTALRYWGFAGEVSLQLTQVSIGGERGAAMPTGTSDLVQFNAPDVHAPTTAASSESQGLSAAGTAGGASSTHPLQPEAALELAPVILPEFDAETAIKEVEPNNDMEQATPLGGTHAATGLLDGKRDKDWFLLEIEGEPQLWSFEASGPGLEHFELYRSGQNLLVRRRMEKDSSALRIDNVLLLPGPYWVQVRPSEDGGAYAVRAVPLGPPDRYAEFEPNDKPDAAQFLRFGEPLRGLIDHEDDKDFYKFSLDQPTHLAVSVTPPKDKTLYFRIESGNGKVSSRQSSDPGAIVAYRALLDPGDYEVMLQDDGGWRSDVLYELRLDRLDPFDLPVDLEPNDTPFEARPIGGLREFSGAVGTFGGSDYFRLPPVSSETSLTVTLEGDPGVRLGLYYRKGEDSASLKLAEDRDQRSDTRRVFRGTLTPDGDGLLLVKGTGDYRVKLAYDPEPNEPTAPPGTSAIALAPLGPVPTFNAFGQEAQEASVSLSVVNNSQAPQRLNLEATTGAPGWDLRFDTGELDLPPGETQTVSGTLRAKPDRPAGPPMPVYVRALDSSGAGTTTMFEVEAACDAPPVAPFRYEPLPPALRGGFNLASIALGGEAVADSDSERRRYEPLFDGMTPLNERYEIPGKKMPFDVTVRLAGEGPVEIAGVILFPRANGRDQSNLGAFEILSSTDGATFSSVYSGHLTRSETEQAFVFDAPVEARFVRLRMERVDMLNRNGKAGFGEWKVIAAPGSRPFADRPLNIASPELGGHIVWASWEADYAKRVAMLTHEDDARSIQVDALKPIEWVVGFNHERAAQISGFEWRNITKVSKKDRRFDSIQISVSTEGPTGPWRSLTDWTLKHDDTSKSELSLPSPVWARFVRFSAPGSDERAKWLIPETLAIFEQPAGNGYLSILGEWGHYARDSLFERTVGATKAAVSEDKGGSGPDTATSLDFGKVLGGRVQIGIDEDWFRVDVPEGMNRIEFRFGGEGAGRVIPALMDNAGMAVQLVEGDEVDGTRTFHAEVTPGATYVLHVTEAKRAIMIAWDNSGSVGAFHETMYRAITRIVDDIRPGTEVVNLLPFRDGAAVPLLDYWTDDPLALSQAIGSYDRKDGSSEAEKTLIGAMTALAQRQGNRGILLLTDANSGGARISAEMWRMFSEVRPRVFAMELQLQTKGVDHFQDLMQDWAAVNDGQYTTFRNQADLDVAFDRAACRLRRPAAYTVALQQAPQSGSLRVAWEDGKAMAGATIELILDASGSMRSSKNKVDGKLKIDVAKEVMTEIVGLLPDDTKVGLRVYGHRIREGSKGDCQDSQLVVQIGALDQKKLTAAIARINALGTTPIAYSLQQAGEDLKDVEGRRLIVLVTDGEEECKADPAAVVKDLRDQGIDIKVDIVGFGLAEEAVKQDMLRAAQASGGQFFDAQDRDALAAAIRKTLAMPFEVLDSRGRNTTAGLTGQQSVSLFPGDYTIIVRTAKGDVTVRDVHVAEGEETDVTLARKEDRIHVRVSDPHKAQ